MNRKASGSDLTDTEWAILAPFNSPAEPVGRPRTTDMREVLDAIFYLLHERLRLLAGAFPRLQHIWADMGYRGCAVEWSKAQLGWTV